MSLAMSLHFHTLEFSVYIMWICKCSSFAFLLLCRKSHKIPLWISLWHMCIMQAWESCINNSIKNTTRIIQWDPSAITAVIGGGLPNPSVDHPESLSNTQTILGSITGLMHPSWEGHSCQKHTSLRHLGNHWWEESPKWALLKGSVIPCSVHTPVPVPSFQPAPVQQSSEGNALILITCWSHQDCVLSWAGVFMSQILFLVIRRPGNTLDGAFDSK